ncbi:MAG TPA: hypothetical protein VII66_12585 [Gemmatimonadaceae bacterium]
MPLVAFSSLPDDARVWVFGSAAKLPSEPEAILVAAIDDYLTGWRAHGSPLTVGRDWRDGRFLAIAVDQRDENASGCSLDALFRVLRDLEPQLGASLLGNARVYFRGKDGSVRVTDRAGFAELALAGSIKPESHVFDLSVQTVGEWRDHFETGAAVSWHRALLPAAV